jgi:cytochrome c-type biogenesis protein
VTFGVATFALSALAGALTSLSPCVLPLIPVLMSTAVASHRLGPLVLAGGVATSFALLGTLLAAVGASLGLDSEIFRVAGAVLFVGFGMLLVSSRLQAGFARLTAAVPGAGGVLLERFTLDGLTGQFVLGLLLGTVWSPCVGPTLGAGVTLASRGQDLGQVGILMAVFGIGASLPLLVVGTLSRAVLARSRGSLRTLSLRGRQLLGVALIGLGVVMLIHADRSLEGWLLDHSPAWLTALTTRF